MGLLKKMWNLQLLNRFKPRNLSITFKGRDEKLITYAFFLVALICIPLSWKFALWNRTMDLALIQSGRVSYPDKNLMTDYYHTWNLPAQIFSILLENNISQISVARIFLWVVLTTFIFTMILPIVLLTRSITLGLLTIIPMVFVYGKDKIPLLRPFEIFWVAPNFSGVTYPALPPINVHTPGLLGLILLLLVINLLLAGSIIKSGFLAGIGVGVHPLYGVVALTFWFLVYFFAHPKNHLKFPQRKFPLGLLAGASISVASFISSDSSSSRSRDHDKLLMSEYLKYWDVHRSPSLELNLRVFLLLIIFIVTCYVILRIFKSKNLQFKFVLKLLMLFSFISGVALIYHIWGAQNVIDNLVTRMQIGRLTLVSGYLIVPFLISLFYLWFKKFVMIFSNFSKIKKTLDKHSSLSRYQNVPLLILILITILTFTAPTRIIDKTCDAPKNNKSVLASSSTALLVLRNCKVAIVLDPTGFDFIPYSPRSLPLMVEVIEMGYGIPFNNPPEITRNLGEIRDESYRDIWENRTANDWQNVAERLNIYAVVVPKDWILDIPDQVYWMAEIKVYVIKY